MECLYPVIKYNPDIDDLKIHRCGYCLSCRKRRAMQFAIRASHEAKYWDNIAFVNLSYDNDFIEPSKLFPFTGNLCRAHLTNFFKSLRTYGLNIKYLCAGEYGDNTFRPHYHCIIFGLSVDDPIFTQKVWSDKKKAWICRCKFWKFGDVVVGNVRPGGYFYITKYLTKADFTKQLRDKMRKAGQTLPFLGISNGVGFRYFLKRPHYFMQSGFMMCNGKKVPIPDYYKEKYFETYSENYVINDYKLKQQSFIQEKTKDILLNKPDYLSLAEWLKVRNKQQEINLMKGK